MSGGCTGRARGCLKMILDGIGMVARAREDGEGRGMNIITGTGGIVLGGWVGR